MKLDVAIDGPAGAGKSTIAKLVGKKFDLMYINTGAMYRAVALKCMEKNIDPNNIDGILKIIDTMEMHFENDDLYLNDVNIQNEITKPEISAVVSSYASIKEVRQKLVKLMRQMSEKYNVIMDGRDIGTVVLKNASFKFFLTASAEERANRRFKELQEKNIECDYNEILEGIKKRDYTDSHREADPLRQSEDAVLIDSTKLDIKGVVDAICGYIEKSQS